MFIATLLATLMVSSSAPSRTYYPKEEGSFRIVTYNVGGFCKYMENSIPTVASMLLECEADIVGLNEVDWYNPRNNYNQPGQLAESLGGWAWHFGNTLNFTLGGYGNAVLVAPVPEIPAYDTVLLGGGIGHEMRCIAVVETSRFVLGSVHLDQKTESMRLKQARNVTKWAEGLMADNIKPVFLCGDFNDFPDSELIAYFEEDWELLSAPEPSFPSDSPSACIDYIFRYKKSAPVEVKACGAMTRFGSGDVSTASDHVPVYVDVVFQ